METINYADFEKLDIRIGTIKEARPHPNADKLYILKIDEGKESLRQLVAGVRENYTAEELTGKKIVFLANLEPKELRGELSEGMILAAVNGSNVSLLTTDKDIPNNSKVQ